MLAVGFIIYNDICQSSPECACNHSKPGDATCMSTEDLTQWCLTQPNPVILPQCMGLEGVYPIETIVQAIIDYEGLQSFLHPEIAERVPLVISDHLINLNLYLKKFDTNVKIVPNEQARGAFLKFTSFDCKFDNYCNISFEYKVEGISGAAGVQIRKDGTVKLEKASIYEE